MNKIKLTAALICGVLFLPATSEASTAVWLSDTTALFTIDFTLSHKSFDIEVPIAASREVSYTDRTEIAGYALQSDTTDIPQITDANALILSNVAASGTKYLIEAGEEASFTMLILATFEEPVADASLRALVTKLPYTFNDTLTSMHQNQLDELPMPSLDSN